MNPDASDVSVKMIFPIIALFIIALYCTISVTATAFIKSNIIENNFNRLREKTPKEPNKIIHNKIEIASITKNLKRPSAVDKLTMLARYEKRGRWNAAIEKPTYTRVKIQ
jgi:ABC-type maltose transport system permease subunit